MTGQHQELSRLAFRWLINQGCVVVTSELAVSVAEKPDALGWRSDGKTILVEAKVSISDMRADASKRFRLMPEFGVGMLRYYAVSREIKDKALELLPQGWGLLVPRGGGLGVEVESKPFDRDEAHETKMLLSIIRRIAGRDEPLIGVGVKCFIHSELINNKNVLLSVDTSAD